MKKNTKIILAAVVLAVIAVTAVVIAMSSGGYKTANFSPPSMDMGSTKPVATSSVIIKNYMFSPASITVKVGTTVTWTNQDAVSHTVTADTNSTDAPSSMDIAQGKSYSFTFQKAGTFTYHCTPHPYMHGTVVVD